MSSSPFLSLIRETMYRRRYAKRTTETYIHWIKDFIIFHKKQHPTVLGESHVEEYLNHLVLDRQVAGQTQAIALNSLSFMYKYIFNKPLSLKLDFVKSKQPRKLPVVLTIEETKNLLSIIPQQYYLLAALLYGSGLWNVCVYVYTTLILTSIVYAYGTEKVANTERLLWQKN